MVFNLLARHKTRLLPQQVPLQVSQNRRGKKKVGVIVYKKGNMQFPMNDMMKWETF